MEINSATTVRELVLEMPQATRVFEKLKIDYCCGGSTRLIDACAKAGVEPKEVEQLLERTATAPETRGDRFQRNWIAWSNRSHRQQASRLHAKRDDPTRGASVQGSWRSR
jgi:iron-sulfur cluster repair protein YtfE (RIC family)